MRHLLILTLKYLLTFFLTFFWYLLPLSGQNEIKGKVTDEKNEPLPGVTILIKGSMSGTTTNIDGDYTIQASPQDTLVFSMIGMGTRTVPVMEQSTIDINLAPEVQRINEVVVVGYGSQRVKDLTAPVVSVSGAELNRQTAANPMQALQGKAAGVQITNKGAPGSAVSVKIRGVGSIGNYANPLYVVDGIIVDSLAFLGANDIEDLTILKDASAAAIYGVRAANGVVLVTTKRGKSGKPDVSYEGYYGVQVPVNIVSLTNKDQYITLLNEANVNTVGYVPKLPASYPSNTDWYDELLRNAGITSHNLNISGANDKTNYAFGGSYFYQNGILKATNDFRRFNFRGKYEHKVSNFLKIGLNSMLSRYDKFITDEETVFFSAFVNPPVYNVYDPENTDAYPVKFGTPGKYGFGNQYGNPVASAYYKDNFEKGNLFLFSASTEFSIIKNSLTFKSSYNLNSNNWNNRDYYPEFNVGGSQGLQNSSLTKNFQNSTKQIIDNLLTYRATTGKHSFTVLLGQSTRLERFEKLTGSALDVPGIDEQSKYILTGSYRDRNSSDEGKVYNGLSFFTRGTYNLSDKYLATITFRADASSKYQQKWGYFPSIGLGWVLTGENFMKPFDKIQFLKLRVSWGMLGNDNIPANSSVTVGTTGSASSGIFGDRLVDGVGAQTVVQNFLKWEVVTEFDAGLDFILAENRLSGDLDYYHRVTDNVVFYVPIATGGGLRDLLGNNGSVLNYGVELNLNWKNKLSENANYRLGLNASFNRNKVLKLEGREYIPGALTRGNYATRTAAGHPIGSFFGFEIDGVYQSESEALRDPVSQPIKDKGFFKYKDQNDDNVIDENDKVYLGSAIPWLIGGFDIGLDYRNVDFSVTFQGQLGNKILNAKRMNRDIFADSNYDLNFYKNRWTPDNKSSEYPSAEAYNFSYTQQANDFFVENGSYIRIQNVQIGYTTNKVKYVPRFRIYISAQRPFTYFAYNGFTPEISADPINNGVDKSVYPMQAIYSLGINLNF